MTDLFHEKAHDWDERPIPTQISEGVFQALESRVQLGPALRVLDFGAGTGLLISKLAPRVDRVLAVDISAAMLERLAGKAELAGKVDIFCQDIVEQPLGQRVDLVVSTMAMHHVEDTNALLRALHAHLVPGGRMALADLDSEDGSFHPPETEGVFHHGFDREVLRQVLDRAGFVDIEFRTACVVTKQDRNYPVFLVTATRG